VEPQEYTIIHYDIHIQKYSEIFGDIQKHTEMFFIDTNTGTGTILKFLAPFDGIKFKDI
jgi:hypothetical protein